jgi:hypothetical protein
MVKREELKMTTIGDAGMAMTNGAAIRQGKIAAELRRST